MTPKNLYRVLTGRGGYSIFPPEALYGLTLIKFWREILEDTLSEDILDHLFPADGTHPRIQSSLMNRTGSNPVPSVLVKGFHGEPMDRTATKLIYNCMLFLTKKAYHPANYRKAMDWFEDCCARYDSLFSPPVLTWLKSVSQYMPTKKNGGIDPQIFADSLRLAAVAMLCLFGPQMGGEEIQRLRTDPGCTAGMLWKKTNMMAATLDPVLMKIMYYPEELTDRAMKLLRLMALLPEDSAQDALDGLREHSCLWEGADEDLKLLKDRGYVNRKGLRPAIRGTLRLDEFSCGEWPEVWRYWAEEIRRETMGGGKQDLYRLVQCALEPIPAKGLNRDGLTVLNALEASAMTRQEEATADWMPAKHREWLEINDHTKADEIDYRIMAELWAILKNDPKTAAEQIAELSRYDAADLLKAENYELLCNVLEIGGKSAGREELNELFSRLHPEEPRQAAVYLTFLGGKQRSIDKQPTAALQTLREGRRIIEQLHMEGTVTEAANDTRTAYALADLHRWEETLPLMKRVMANLKKRGYNEKSHTWQVTRESYLYFQGQCRKKREAREALEQELEKAGDREGIDYLRALANYTSLLTEAAMKDEALRRAGETTALCRKRPDFPDDVISYGLRIAGEAILAYGNGSEALGLFTEADILSRRDAGEDTIASLRCQADMALALKSLGRAEAGTEIMNRVAETVNHKYPEAADEYRQYAERMGSR